MSDAAQIYDQKYYQTSCGSMSYDPSEPHWQEFFGSVADGIVSSIRPRTYLDMGCAMGFLVAEMVKRGVDSQGIDYSEYAISRAEEVMKGLSSHVSVGSATDPIDGRYDLISCVEVLEHLSAADARIAVRQMSLATDVVLFSSSPYDYTEPTHLNVQPAAYWAGLFAEQGMHRDQTVDASFLTPWAIVFRRDGRAAAGLVSDYEEERSRLVEERNSLRDEVQRLFRLTEEEAPDPDPEPEVVQDDAEVNRLNSEVLALNQALLMARDAAVGADAEAGQLRGRVVELEQTVLTYREVERNWENLFPEVDAKSQQLDDIQNSRSWRLLWSVLTPYRQLRHRLSK